MQERSASFTAYNIVLTLLNLSARNEWRHQLPDAALPLLHVLRDHSADSVPKRLARALPAPLQLALMEALFVPGMGPHFMCRKNYIEQAVRSAIAEGWAQFVVIGAGFDTLALRLAAEFPDTCWAELDLPGTQAQKQRALNAGGVPIPPNCYFKPCDLAEETLPAILATLPSIRPELPIFFVIEGVLMYVPAKAVGTLFQHIRDYASSGARIAYGAIEKPDDEANGFFHRLTAKVLGLFGESIGWTCAFDAMPQFIASRGFTLERAVRYRDLQVPYISQKAAEKLPVKDENYFIAKTVGSY